MSATPTRERELPERAPAARPEVDPAPLLGTWVVFEPGTTGIRRVEVEPGSGTVTARVAGSSDDGEPDWGPAPAVVFADDVAGATAWGFRADYDHGWQRVRLFGYLNRGLLVVEAATTFAADDGRADYFTREFMYRL